MSDYYETHTHVWLIRVYTCHSHTSPHLKWKQSTQRVAHNGKLNLITALTNSSRPIHRCAVAETTSTDLLSPTLAEVLRFTFSFLICRVPRATFNKLALSLI